MQISQIKTVFSRFGMVAAMTAGLSLGLSAAPAAAGPQEEFPAHAIRLVVPFPAGGSTDIVARIAATKMSEILKQPVMVENLPGKSGNVAASAVAKAAPDGYTVLMGTVATHAINPALFPKLPYDPVKDFEPVSLLVNVPNVIVVDPSLNVKTLQELIALLKANPGTYKYATAGGVGTALHLSGALVESQTGAKMTHADYLGASYALVDLVNGKIKIMFDNLPSSLPQIRKGNVVPLAVTTAKRSPVLPDVPTVAESGLPGYETYTWNAIFAPAGTPQPIVDKLASACAQAMQDPQVKAHLASLSATAVGSTPSELSAHVKAEMAKWAPIVKASGASIDN